ncbi:embryogenesis-like protein [Malania oleifera]|uniref:embryogenesis-like protein n=1 Tax=Malania oleifera TaxID=397392 RepID=UPI0025ADEF5D|nr:embryogenesis-like protein [Malania oleifera]
MLPRSQISLCKLLLRHPFASFATPASSFFCKSLASVSRPTLKFLHFPPQTRPNPATQFRPRATLRLYSSVDTNKEVDAINLKFAEAREEIEMALESKETVYFDEEAECARAVVKEVLEMFDGLLAKLPDGEKAALQRSMGLKIEQLKAELQQLND